MKFASCNVCGVKAIRKGQLLYTRPSNGKELKVYSYFFKDVDGWYDREVEVKPNADSIKPVFVCPSCSRITNYHASTDYITLGSLNRDGVKFGVELESNGELPENTKKCLRDNGFILEHDGSLNGDGGEYVSPIYRSLSSLGHYIHTMYNLGFRTDSDCGTHVNLSIDNSIMSYEHQRKVYSYIRRFYNSIFSDLSIWMDGEGRNIVKDVFGRNLGRWAKPITNDSVPATSHSNSRYFWINTEHTTDNTSDVHLRLEIRLPKWDTQTDTNGQKFLNTIRCCRAIYKVLMNIEDLDIIYTSASEKRTYCNSIGEEIKAIIIKYATTKKIY